MKSNLAPMITPGPSPSRLFDVKAMARHLEAFIQEMNPCRLWDLGSNGLPMLIDFIDRSLPAPCVLNFHELYVDARLIEKIPLG